MNIYNDTFHDDYEDYWFTPRQFILLGPPGSGKSTVAEAIAKEYGTAKFSAGSLLREEIVCDTILGAKIKEIVERGELVGTDIMQELLIRDVDKNSASYVFDNFPKSVEQAKLLRNFFTHNQLIVIRLDISEEEADSRIARRSSVTARTDDQNPDVVQRRRDIYEEDLTEIIQTLLSDHDSAYFAIDCDDKSTIDIMNEIRTLMKETV